MIDTDLIKQLVSRLSETTVMMEFPADYSERARRVVARDNQVVLDAARKAHPEWLKESAT